MNSGGPSIVIRPAQRRDLPALFDLYHQAGLDTDPPLSAEEGERLFERLSRYPDYHAYVAVQGHEVIGTYSLLIMDNLSHRGRPSGVIESVAVRPDWQHQGVGRQMMRHACDLCRSRGCYKAALSSNLRRVDAHRFYRSLGFDAHGISFVIGTD